MSQPLFACGFLVLDPSGMPIIEATSQGRQALVFLDQTDAMGYRQQVAQVRKMIPQRFAIAALPLQRIQRLLCQEKVHSQIVEALSPAVA